MISPSEMSKGVANLVTKLNFHDVLMGRGAPAIDNEGNVRFRRLVHGRRGEYAAASKRSEKDQIAREIVSSIREKGGRFLKKLEDPDLSRNLDAPEGSDAWITVDEETVLTKTKQALRDKSTEDEGPDRKRRRKRVTHGNLVPENDEGCDTGNARSNAQRIALPAINHRLGGATFLATIWLLRWAVAA